MTDDNYTKIFSGNFIIAKLIISKLEEIGIHAIIKDETESGRLAGFGAPIIGFQELYVANDNVDKAVPIVQQAVADTQA